jgi:hypothetical protein
MRKLFPLVCISLVTLLSACGSPDDGYYDTNGNWIANNPYNHSHPPLPGGTHDSRSDHTIYDDNRAVSSTTVTTTTYNYDQPGYYNSDGSYIGKDSSFAVPHRMFPPSGMCRVWFTDRTADNQPAIESCDGIRSRVPAGAYVIYGG